ncbi:growth hormone secretagogue receptor type 1-like [Ciona intestinalis]
MGSGGDFTTIALYNNELSNVSRPTNYNYIAPFDEVAVVISATLLLPMMLFGIFANILTISVIYKSKNLRTSTFNLFIASLCVSDCISALISPLFLYRRTWGFDEWKISNFLCKLFWGADNGTSLSTSLHILIFAFLRFYSSTWPFRYKEFKVKHAQICIGCIWLVAIICGFIPFCVWMNARKMNRNVLSQETGWPSCTIDLYWFENFKTYAVAGYAVFFYIPMVLILLLSIGVTVIIYYRRFKRNAQSHPEGKNVSSNAEVRRRRKEQQAFVQLYLIVGSFMLGYIPHTAYHIYATTTKAVTREDEIFHWWFGMLEYLCLRFSECLNPVFYNLASSKMRNKTKKQLAKMFGCLSVTVNCNHNKSVSSAASTKTEKTKDSAV